MSAPFLPCLVVETDTIPVHPHPSLEWTLPTADVARGYGCGIAAIRNQKMRRPEELLEGKHWFTISGVTNCDARGNGNLTTDQTHWTRRGVVRLGFFLRTPRARLFRDAAEDLVVAALDGAAPADLPALVAAEIARQLAGDTAPAPSGPLLPARDLVALLAGLPQPALRLYADLLLVPGERTLACPTQARAHFGGLLRALHERRLVHVVDPGSWSRSAYTVEVLPLP